MKDSQTIITRKKHDSININTTLKEYIKNKTEAYAGIDANLNLSNVMF